MLVRAPRDSYADNLGNIGTIDEDEGGAEDVAERAIANLANAFTTSGHLHGRCLHSSTSHLNLTRFGTETTKSTTLMVLTSSREVDESCPCCTASTGRSRFASALSAAIRGS
jgi:hypothetical protein